MQQVSWGRNRQGDRLADEGNDFSGDARVG